MGVQLILQIVSLENWKERVHLKTCVNIRGWYWSGFYGILSEWILTVHASGECWTILQWTVSFSEYLDKLSNQCHPRKHCTLDVYSFMISSVLFSSGVHFLLSSTHHLN
jgi:hypothetical protein